MPKHNHKTAVILFNLGGPDQLSSVKPFLFNLFNDKAIISLPNPFRYLLAKFISSRREKKAQGIYKEIGGKSPLLDITLAQADSLNRELSFYGEFKVFVAMRYWHPFVEKAIKQVKEYQPQQIILLPLYPQFSSTTTASSINNFIENFNDTKTSVKVACCYPTHPDFIKSHALQLKQIIEKIPAKNLCNIRILFSAHGLPKSVINKGDPYVFQVEETAKKVMEILPDICNEDKINHFEYKICYQSKVGPMEWTSPSLDQEIRSIALDKKIPIIVPIAFVSDHSETLVELDIEYRELAHNLGIKEYHRVASLNIDRSYINSLCDIVLSISKNEEFDIFCGNDPKRICPKNFKLCPNQNSC